MSSSLRNARPTNRGRVQEAVRFSSLACPICGRKTLREVVEDCELSAGRAVRHLRHTRCRSCGERFFDVAAMRAIEAARKPTARRRSE